jgi:hypothetical protein
MGDVAETERLAAAGFARRERRKRLAAVSAPAFSDATSALSFATRRVVFRWDDI